MKGRLGSVFLEAAKLLILLGSVQALEPWIQENLPNVGIIPRYVLAAITSALLLELVFQVGFGWPRLTIRWKDNTTDVPIQSLYARVSKRKENSQVHTIHLIREDSGWLGTLYFKWLIGRETTLQIRIEQATVQPMVESSSNLMKRPAVVPNDKTKGFDITLGALLDKPGTWHWAEVSWRKVDLPKDIEVNVDYKLHHPKRLHRVLLGLTVHPSSNVSRFQVVEG